ncbi:MAG TPA: protein phosphatase, partial [Propionibacteriaceae bacterium]|nr:protein phosphatase [Propionibacteriaceae bacterium]
MPLTLRTVAHSEIGLVRKNNQDSGYASPTMVVVADGMGGAAAGDLASTVAITELQKADGLHKGREMLTVLGDALQSANDRIADLVADDPSLDGMGTTVCGALF